MYPWKEGYATTQLTPMNRLENALAGGMSEVWQWFSKMNSFHMFCLYLMLECRIVWNNDNWFHYNINFKSRWLWFIWSFFWYIFFFSFKILTMIFKCEFKKMKDGSFSLWDVASVLNSGEQQQSSGASLRNLVKKNVGVSVVNVLFTSIVHCFN